MLRLPAAVSRADVGVDDVVLVAIVLDAAAPDAVVLDAAVFVGDVMEADMLAGVVPEPKVPVSDSEFARSELPQVVTASLAASEEIGQRQCCS